MGTKKAELAEKVEKMLAGVTVRGRNETRGVLPDRTTAVHYVKFPLGIDLARRFVARADEEPKGSAFFVLDHAKLALRQELPAATVKAIAQDLTS
jgi:hypothetical protein